MGAAVASVELVGQFVMSMTQQGLCNAPLCRCVKRLVARCIE